MKTRANTSTVLGGTLSEPKGAQTQSLFSGSRQSGRSHELPQGPTNKGPRQSIRKAGTDSH